MTKEEIIELAREAGMTSLSLIDIGYLEHFANLVAAKEREMFINLIKNTACVWSGDGYAAITALRKELITAVEEMK